MIGFRSLTRLVAVLSALSAIAASLVVVPGNAAPAAIKANPVQQIQAPVVSDTPTRTVRVVYVGPITTR
jgi:hypothetical protein